METQTEFSYDAPTSGERWLILNDKEQEFPTADLEVINLEVRKTQTGKDMPVLTLENPETGERYQVCAWARDVKAVIAEYGTKPSSWDKVKFERKNGRICLLPAGMKVKTESI